MSIIHFKLYDRQFELSIIHFKLYNRQIEVNNRQFEVYNQHSMSKASLPQGPDMWYLTFYENKVPI